MTIVGPSGPGALGNTPVNRLKKYRFSATKDYSASDTRQIPLTGASVTVYKQGATCKDAGSIAVGGSGTILVYDIGKVLVGDSVFLNETTTTSATVTAITTESISVSNVAGATLTWAIGDRVRASTNLPTLYSDIHSGGDSIDNPMTVDSRGLAECYAVENIVDAIISGNNIDSIGVVDEVGAFPLAEIRYADEFPGADWGAKLAAALADLDETYGGIVDCRGLKGLQAAITADPFSGVTWPYTVIFGHGIYETDVALQAALGDYQSVLGPGVGQATIRASLSFPTATPLMRWGNSGGALGCRIAGLTLDCNSIASSVGLHAAGCNEGALAENLEIKNAKLYGVRLNNTLVACRDFRMRNLRIHTSNASAIGVIFDTGCGPNNSLDGLYAVSAAGITGTAAVQKSVAQPVKIHNVSAVRYTHTVQLSSPGGGADIANIYGDSTVTNVVRVESGTADYALRNIVRNSATNVLNDADLPSAYTDDVLNDFVNGRPARMVAPISVSIPNGEAVGIDLVIPATTTASDYAIREMVNASARFGLRKDGFLSVERVLANLGTAATSADFGSLHANWGTGATISAISYGTDFLGHCEINTGTTAGADPTVVYTFKSAWPIAPAVLISVNGVRTTGAFGAGEYITVSAVSTTSITFKFIGTPDDSKVYSWWFHCVGMVA